MLLRVAKEFVMDWARGFASGTTALQLISSLNYLGGYILFAVWVSKKYPFAVQLEWNH